MAENAELAFVKSHIGILGSLPVQFPNDYQQPPEHWSKRAAIVPIDLPDPPEVKAQDGASSQASVNLSFKSVKPPITFDLPSVSLAEPISALKARLALQPRAPPEAGQRLLLRGKALVDNKLVKEYDLKDGDVINVMLKPGFQWDWKVAPPKIEIPKADGDGDVQMHLSLQQPTPRRHSRTPSIVLSPSPSPIGNKEDTLDINLTLDASEIPTASDYNVPDAFQRKIADPAFWQNLYSFLGTEFSSEADVLRAFEAFLLGGKGELSATDIAKIRDGVGISGMSGT